MFDTLTPTTLTPNSLTPSTPDVASPTIPEQGPRRRLLVFAPNTASPVFLADSETETADEHLFRCADDLVRLPRSSAVAVRAVHHSDAAFPAPGAERALLEAVVAANRRSQGSAEKRPDVQSVLAPAAMQADTWEITRRFSSALQRGDGPAAHALALLLQQADGLGELYELLRRILNEVGESWARGRATVLSEHLVTSAASTVVELLRALTAAPGPSAGTVVVTAPSGDRHLLGLAALGHLLEDAGHRVVVAADLPLAELLTLSAQPEVVAVVLSCHTPVTASTFHSLVASLRKAKPALKIAVGGPGLPHSLAVRRSCGADLVSSDPAALLELLVVREMSLLTARESEVLRAVADGLTNAEIATRLGIGAATVKSHLDSVLSKTGTEHRAAAVARALRAGWIS